MCSKRVGRGARGLEDNDPEHLVGALQFLLSHLPLQWELTFGSDWKSFDEILKCSVSGKVFFFFFYSGASNVNFPLALGCFICFLNFSVEDGHKQPHRVASAGKSSSKI